MLRSDRGDDTAASFPHNRLPTAIMRTRYCQYWARAGRDKRHYCQHDELTDAQLRHRSRLPEQWRENGDGGRHLRVEKLRSDAVQGDRCKQHRIRESLSQR